MSLFICKNVDVVFHFSYEENSRKLILIMQMMRDSRINFIGEICNILRMPRFSGLSENRIPGVAGYPEGSLAIFFTLSILFLAGYKIFSRISSRFDHKISGLSYPISSQIPVPAIEKCLIFRLDIQPNIWCNSTCRISGVIILLAEYLV